MSALLEVQHLRVELPGPAGSVAAVRKMSFKLATGERLGLIGESGCGKSTAALALMGLHGPRIKIEGSVKLHGQELLGLSDRAWQGLRGNRIAMVFQEPMTALNPVHRVGHQIAEPLQLHRGLDARSARRRTIELMERVGIPQPALRVNAYPHQFSGGQRQRLMIAMALACEPDVLIADEPTSALDVTVQQQILALIRELVAERGMALLLISHDLGLIMRHTQRLLVMYGGSVVESGPSELVFSQPAHPYTRGLLAARPSLAQRLVAHRSVRLPTIAGSVPDLPHLPPGCPFAGRCPYTAAECFNDIPPAVALSPGHRFDCLRADVVLRDSNLPILGDFREPES